MAAESSVPLVLVTGASGFVASHCLKLLQESGEYRVRGTVRSLKNKERCEAIQNLVKDPRFPIELVEANLLEQDGWKKAVKGCTYVLHIASPFMTTAPKHEDELIKPAVEGTKNVLRAAVETGGIKRVVLTSSMVAVFIGNNTKELDESVWSDTNLTAAYEKSKTLAEKAAWDFVNDLPADEKFELAVINPGFVLGPVLLPVTGGASFENVKKLLMRGMLAVPEIFSPMVDVRDVAKAHFKAMTLPEAAGNRHLLASNVESFLFLANALAKEFDSQGYNVPTKKVPKFVVWVMSWFTKDAKTIYPYIGMRLKVNNSRMKDVLQIEPVDIAASVIEMAHTMIEKGLVEKRAGYRGRSKAKATEKSIGNSEFEMRNVKKEKSDSKKVEQKLVNNEKQAGESKSGALDADANSGDNGKVVSLDACMSQEVGEKGKDFEELSENNGTISSETSKEAFPENANDAESETASNKNVVEMEAKNCEEGEENVEVVNDKARQETEQGNTCGEKDVEENEKGGENNEEKVDGVNIEKAESESASDKKAVEMEVKDSEEGKENVEVVNDEARQETEQENACGEKEVEENEAGGENNEERVDGVNIEKAESESASDKKAVEMEVNDSEEDKQNEVVVNDEANKEAALENHCENKEVKLKEDVDSEEGKENVEVVTDDASNEAELENASEDNKVEESGEDHEQEVEGGTNEGIASGKAVDKEEFQEEDSKIVQENDSKDATLGTTGGDKEVKELEDVDEKELSNNNTDVSVTDSSIGKHLEKVDDSIDPAVKNSAITGDA